jgi:hypothetical protein
VPVGINPRKGSVVSGSLVYRNGRRVHLQPHTVR